MLFLYKAKLISNKICYIWFYINNNFTKAVRKISVSIYTFNNYKCLYKLMETGILSSKTIWISETYNCNKMGKIWYQEIITSTQFSSKVLNYLNYRAEITWNSSRKYSPFTVTFLMEACFGRKRWRREDNFQHVL